MSNKRVTIYDLARELGISASYISKALNDRPSVSEKVRTKVKRKAAELNYKHNSHAANLRNGSSKTMGVIVPHINQGFFSEVIAGVEEVCFENNYSLIICQSHELFLQECKAVNTLIHQNVDCILISVSAETQSIDHLENIRENGIELIQFDRCMDKLNSYKVVNDNEEVSYNVVKNLIKEGYKKIAFIGGPAHQAIFSDRKNGYLRAIKEAGLIIPYNYIIDDVLSKEKAMRAASELLKFSDPPDAFFTVSDHQSLGVVQVAELLGLKVPDQLGVSGFANEEFAEIIKPALSSVDQKSKELGKVAAHIYFEKLLKKSGSSIEEKKQDEKKQVVKCDIITRESTKKTI